MTFAPARNIKHSRVRKQCDWCNGWIEIGEPKFVQFWFEERSETTMHPECATACGKYMCDTFDEEMPNPGSHRRGCWCDENDEDCICENDRRRKP